MNFQLYLILCYLAIALCQPRGLKNEPGNDHFREKWRRIKGKLENSDDRGDGPRARPDRDNHNEDNNYQYVTWSNDVQAQGYIKFSLFSSQSVRSTIEEQKSSKTKVVIQKPSVITINFNKKKENSKLILDKN